MNQTFYVAVTKSFVVKIEAENEKSALEFTEFFTSDIFDLSTERHKKEYQVRISEIENTYTLAQIIERTETNEQD